MAPIGAIRSERRWWPRQPLRQRGSRFTPYIPNKGDNSVVAFRKIHAVKSFPNILLRFIVCNSPAPPRRDCFYYTPQSDGFRTCVRRCLSVSRHSQKNRSARSAKGSPTINTHGFRRETAGVVGQRNLLKETPFRPFVTPKGASTQSGKFRVTAETCSLLYVRKRKSQQSIPPI